MGRFDGLADTSGGRDAFRHSSRTVGGTDRFRSLMLRPITKTSSA